MSGASNGGSDRGTPAPRRRSWRRRPASGAGSSRRGPAGVTEPLTQPAEGRAHVAERTPGTKGLRRRCGGHRFRVAARRRGPNPRDRRRRSRRGPGDTTSPIDLRSAPCPPTPVPARAPPSGIPRSWATSPTSTPTTCTSMPCRWSSASAGSRSARACCWPGPPAGASSARSRSTTTTSPSPGSRRRWRRPGWVGRRRSVRASR